VKKRVGRMTVKKMDKVVSASVIAWHYSVLTLLDYMGQTGFEYGGITVARKIHTAIKRSLNKQPLQTIPQNKCQFCKKKVICNVCECTKQNVLDYLC
jgi:hypothetical protein